MVNNLTILLEDVFFEGKPEDFYIKQKEKYPNKSNDIDYLLSKQVPVKYFDWIYKQISTTNEPIKDIVPLIQSFEKNQNKLVKKNIHQYKNVGELHYNLEDLNKNKELKLQSNRIVSSDIQDVIAQADGWFVVFPHTTESSCDLGSGTTWCTARTQSGNMFLNYVGRNKNIILFYVINPNLNPRKESHAKMSIGYINGEPTFDKGENNITVKSDNSNLSEQEFIEIVGQNNANLFLGAMNKKVESLEGTHPAQKELIQIAQNYDLFLKKVATYKDTQQNYEAKKDFLELLSGYDEEPDEKIPLNDQVEKYINVFFNNIEHRKDIAKGEYPELNTWDELLKLSKDLDYEVRVAVAKNPDSPTEVLLLLSSDTNDTVQRVVATRPLLPIKGMENLSKSDDYFVRINLANNQNLPPHLLEMFTNDENTAIRAAVATHRNTPKEILLKLVKDPEFQVRENVLKNNNSPIEVFKLLSKDKYPLMREMVAYNKRIPSEILNEMMKVENDVAVIRAIIANPNTTLETLNDIINEKYFQYNEDIKYLAKHYFDNKTESKKQTVKESIKQRNINNFLAILNYKSKNGIKK